jgi:ferric-dicitrate binding protein FerR (iron transport regulator)
MAEPAVDRERLEQAAHWHLALLADDVSADEFSRVLAWCDADPRNREALERIQQTWVSAGAMAREADAAIQQALQERPPTLPCSASGRLAACAHSMVGKAPSPRGLARCRGGCRNSGTGALAGCLRPRLRGGACRAPRVRAGRVGVGYLA